MGRFQTKEVVVISPIVSQPVVLVPVVAGVVIRPVVVQSAHGRNRCVVALGLDCDRATR